MTILAHDDDKAFELVADGDELLMIVLCGGIGLYEVKFHLNPEERSEYETRGVEYLRELADQVRQDEPQFSARASTRA